MQISVQVEKTSNISRKLKVTISKDSVAKKFEQALIQVQKNAKVKGFRPGHVPMNIVKQFYGSDLRHQLYHDIIDDGLREAIVQEKLRVVGNAKLEDEHKHDHAEHGHEGHKGHDHDSHEGHILDENKDFSFTATVDIIPEVEVKGYTGIALTKDKVVVSEEDIKKVLENFADSRSELVPAENRASKKGDYVDITFKGGLIAEDGTADIRDEMSGSRVVMIGEGSLIEGFEENLEGLKNGDTKTFKLRFPEDYAEKSYASKEAEFTATLNSIKEKRVPIINNELAEELGFENLEKMREQAQGLLTKERETQSRRKLESDLLESLIGKNTFEIPQSLVESQTRVLMEDFAKELKERHSFNENMIRDALTQEVETLKKRAEAQVRASLILDTVAKNENLTVEYADVNKELERIATDSRMALDKIKDMYKEGSRRYDNLVFRLKEEKTIHFLIEKAKVKEK